MEAVELWKLMADEMVYTVYGEWTGSYIALFQSSIPLKAHGPPTQPVASTIPTHSHI